MEKQPSRSKRGRYGISREQWLAAALDLLEMGGVDAVRIHTLAKTLGINKSGFYWHFEDRPALLKAVLEYWVGLEEAPIDSLAGDPMETPAKVLREIAENVDRNDLSRFDAAIRQWSKTDPAVAAVYWPKIEQRITFVRSLFEALGFDSTAADMRARTYVGFVSTERELFPSQPHEERAALREARLKLLISQE